MHGKGGAALAGAAASALSPAAGKGRAGAMSQFSASVAAPSDGKSDHHLSVAGGPQAARAQRYDFQSKEEFDGHIKAYREYLAGVLEPVLEGGGFAYVDPDVDLVGSDSEEDYVYDLKSGYDSAEHGDHVTVKDSNYDPYDSDNLGMSQRDPRDQRDRIFTNLDSFDFAQRSAASMQVIRTGMPPGLR